MSNLKVIKSTLQYAMYCDELERLTSLESMSIENEETIELLSVLIEKWDEENSTSAEILPVDMLKHLMALHDLRPADLSQQTGINKTVLSKILNYKKSFSKEVIRVLSIYFKVKQEAFNKPYALRSESNENAILNIKSTKELKKKTIYTKNEPSRFGKETKRAMG